MGVDLKDLVIKHHIELSELRRKKIAIDAFNILFQFLSSIRQRDGQPLMDSQGNVTSHLVGLLSRTTKFIESGIFPCYIFDGKAPLEKQSTQEARREIREEARIKYEQALAEGP